MASTVGCIDLLHAIPNLGPAKFVAFQKVYPLMYFRRRLTCIFVFFAFLLHAHGYHKDNVKGALSYIYDIPYEPRHFPNFSPHSKKLSILANKLSVDPPIVAVIIKVSIIKTSYGSF